MIADLHFIENVTAPRRLPDDRGRFARLFDRIIGTVHPGVIVITQLPLRACAVLRKALADFARE
ncbi:MAG: hypothetical protein KF834_08605 [Burkholderiales bacterium]|nr:hypothetical protein [Burkholderiales bacterium]